MLGTNPFRELDLLRREVDRLFEGFASPPNRAAFLPGRAARSYPLINLYETADEVLVEALAPGVDPKSLEVTLQENALLIAGEKPRPAGEIAQEAWHRNERAAGRFLRQVKLPTAVDQDKVAADYRNGILTVRLQKSEAARPRRIAINAA
ncbi:MAG: Hsp20/alpha crystallin family protein [Candidatus Sumerlaeia bacterium]|nr:Hsp20/alpha crystallin family protein [Candidatus Sumerlaeia bacterium]